jgi:DNA (cytosine-5)-methyltransferase 1
MTHGSLFSGIGGFELAAQWMDWDNIFHCEWNEFGQKVLKHHFPKSISYEDITKTDFSIHRGTIDILTGGFPCQPYSTAGKRLGKEDERHLWPEMLRAIREIEPRWVVGENVRGLVSWSGGLVFEEVQTDLEAQGYSVQPFLLPAASVNAPHRRDRIWFVAHSNNNRNSNGFRQVQNENGKISKWNDNAKSSNSDKRNIWDSFPSVAPICTGDDGLSDRLDSITFPKWRNESIKAGGNAIVPQVAHQIFKAIQEYEQHYGSRLQ